MAEIPCCIGRGVTAIRHKTGSRSFTYYSMLSLSSDFAEFETMGTVFGCMGKKHFLDVKCICPPTEIVETLERLAFPLDHGIESNENQSRALAAIRDALLPKLMSGEIRVKDAEKFVGRTI